MPKILLAVDGSEGASRTARKLVEAAAWFRDPLEVELVNVQLPVPPVGGLSWLVVSKDMIDRFYKEEGEKALAPSREILSAAGVSFTPHILVGDIAPMILAHAERTACRMIFMGTRGITVLASLLVGSVAARVLHLATVPVTLVR